MDTIKERILNEKEENRIERNNKERIEKQQRNYGEDQHRKDAKEQQKNGNNERVERESTDELRKQIQWRHKKVEGARDVLPNKGIRDAGSTADIRMLWPWSALVCLGLL